MESLQELATRISQMPVDEIRSFLSDHIKINTKDQFALWMKGDESTPVVQATACYCCPMHCTDKYPDGSTRLSCRALGNLVLAWTKAEIDAMDMFNPDKRCPLLRSKYGIVELVSSNVYPNWSK